MKVKVWCDKARTMYLYTESEDIPNDLRFLGTIELEESEFVALRKIEDNFLRGQYIIHKRLNAKP